MKLFFLILALTVVWLLFFKLRPASKIGAPRKSAGRPRRVPQDMVRCEACGSFVPQDTSLPVAQGRYRCADGCQGRPGASSFRARR